MWVCLGAINKFFQSMSCLTCFNAPLVSCPISTRFLLCVSTQLCSQCIFGLLQFASSSQLAGSFQRYCFCRITWFVPARNILLNSFQAARVSLAILCRCFAGPLQCCTGASLRLFQRNSRLLTTLSLFVLTPLCFVHKSLPGWFQRSSHFRMTMCLCALHLGCFNVLPVPHSFGGFTGGLLLGMLQGCPCGFVWEPSTSSSKACLA